MSKSTLFLLTTFLFLSCSTALADQVTLKNGDRLTGDILKSDTRELLIKTEFAGEVKVQWPAIEGISSAQPLHVRVGGGQKLVGSLTTSGDKIDIATQNAGVVTIAKDSIESLRSAAEQTSYDAQIESMLHPRLSDFWSGYLDAGLSTTRGNAETLNFALGARAVRAAPHDKITVYSNSIFATNSTTGASVTTAHAITGGIRGDFDLRARVFAFGFTDFEFDQFQKLDLRNVLGGGIGYHIVKTDPTTFDVFGGGSYNQAYYSTGVNRKNAEVLAGEELEHKFSAKSFLSERFVFYPNITDAGQYRMTFDFGATTKLSNWLNWQVSLGDRHVSNPITGIKKNDLLLTTGVRLVFGKGNL